MANYRAKKYDDDGNLNYLGEGFFKGLKKLAISQDLMDEDTFTALTEPALCQLEASIKRALRHTQTSSQPSRYKHYAISKHYVIHKLLIQTIIETSKAQLRKQ